MKRFFLITFISFFFYSHQTLGITIIVNKEGVSHLKKNMIKKYFLGDEISWSDDEPVLIADYVSRNKLRKTFSSKILKLKPMSVYKKWIQISLAGDAPPPNYFQTEFEVISYVRSTIGSLGYVSDQIEIPKGVAHFKVD